MTLDEIFKKKQQDMSDEELMVKCREQISELAKTGGSSFRMCVPPSIYDTDMLFCELIDRYKVYKEYYEATRQP